MKESEAVAEIMKEYFKVCQRHRAFQSPHEGYAIIKEELDELWDSIRKVRHFKERPKEMRTEAIQIGAMALRFLVDLIEE